MIRIAILICAFFGLVVSQYKVSALFTTDGCGITKGCLQLDDNCDPKSPDCTFFSWTYNVTLKQFLMKISGRGNGLTYAAVAFGPEEKMKDADLYYCTGTAIKSGVIRQDEQTPTDLNFESESGLASLKTTTADGVAQCEFTREASITKEISNGARYNFDLSTQKYWILMATGPISTTGKTTYHENRRRFSTHAVDLTSGAEVSSQGLQRLFVMLLLVTVATTGVNEMST